MSVYENIFLTSFPYLFRIYKFSRDTFGMKTQSKNPKLIYPMRKSGKISKKFVLLSGNWQEHTVVYYFFSEGGPYWSR